MTREEMLNTYNIIKFQLGRQPVMKDMLKHGGVTSYEIVRRFRTYGDLVRAAGDTPFLFEGKVYPEEFYYNAYGEFLRELGRVPTYSDWVFHDRKPTISAMIRRMKAKWSEMPYAFMTYAAGKREWDDVVKLIPERKPEPKNKNRPWEAADPKLFDATPPMLHDIVPFAFAEGSPAEFEKKCVLAFRMLGFDVRELGSGKGRNPDGIARDIRGRYAVIYDAKSRRDHYTIGTDDRQFTEYIKEHKKALASAGYEMVFFLIISGAFGTMLPAPLNRIKLETGVTMSYITAENLLRLLAIKTTEPNKYELGKIKELLINGGEMKKENIKEILKR